MNNSKEWSNIREFAKFAVRLQDRCNPSIIERLQIKTAYMRSKTDVAPISLGNEDRRRSWRRLRTKVKSAIKHTKWADILKPWKAAHADSSLTFEWSFCPDADQFSWAMVNSDRIAVHVRMSRTPLQKETGAAFAHTFARSTGGSIRNTVPILLRRGAIVFVWKPSLRTVRLSCARVRIARDSKRTRLASSNFRPIAIKFGKNIVIHTPLSSENFKWCFDCLAGGQWRWRRERFWQPRGGFMTLFPISLFSAWTTDAPRRACFQGVLECKTKQYGEVSKRRPEGGTRTGSKPRLHGVPVVAIGARATICFGSALASRRFSPQLLRFFRVEKAALIFLPKFR
jgi:hypothetical protein